MKLYSKLALLTCVLAVSTPILADNAKIAVPLKALGSSVDTKAGPGTSSSPAHVFTKPTLGTNPPATTKRGANLTTNIEWDDEFCMPTCPKIARDLKIADATCAISVRIRNTGDTAATGSFRIRLDWTDHDGTTDSRVKIVNGVGINQTKYVKITAEDIGYYRIGRPFTVTVDDHNQVRETNENDNVATLQTRL
jgi:hypothetical protein